MTRRDALLERIADFNWRGNRIWIVSVVILAAYAIFQINHDVFKLNGKGMVPILVPGERYVVDTTQTSPCTGDLIQFGAQDGLTYVRRVIGVAGQTMTVTESGYEIGAQSVAMSPAWQQAATAALDGKSELTVPEGQFLVRRENPDTDDVDTYEAFQLALAANVKGTVTRVFLAWNPLRIGARVGGGVERVCADA